MQTEKREYTIGHTTYIVITHYNSGGETLANLIKRLITK